MKILVIGGGGREHAVSWLISQSKNCDKIFIATGNAGTSMIGENLGIDINNFDAIKDKIQANNIDLVIVGPEDPIVNGITDYFKSSTELQNVAILAPTKAAAQLEGSKDFAKEFMFKFDIPTAKYKTFTIDRYNEVIEYINSHKTPIVVKADGLAAGKGVTVCNTVDEAKDAVVEIFLDKKFGDAGNKVVIEEFLDGIEISVFVLTDGKNYILMPEAKDYKRIGEGDVGPNTGGMGAVSPVPFADDEFLDKVKTRIIEPTIKGIQSEKLDYRGFIFFGLMNINGDPYVIEYNVRLGDPEAEAILPRIDEDFLPLMYQAAKGNLNSKTLKVKDQFSTTVMLASGGYPGAYEKGKVISGIEEADNTIVFHSGTKNVDNKIITSGGRVLGITSLAEGLQSALKKTYVTADRIDFDEKYFRRDIGKDLLQYIK